MPRLVFGVVLLALASLTVIPAQTTLMWQAEVVATEWGHLIAVAALVPLLGGWRRTGISRLSALACGLAAIVALIPLARATLITPDIETLTGQALGSAPPLDPCGQPSRPAPLSFTELFLQPRPRPAPVERREYARHDGQPLTLDIRRPSTIDGCQRTAPVIIVVHGGSWQRGDSTALSSFNDELTHRGYLVIAINYRLAPRWRFPAARDDVLAAVRFVRANAPTLGADPSRIALIGRSSGGQLALSAAYAAPPGSVRGVVSLYAPADLRFSYANPANPAVLDSRGTLDAYLGGPPETAGEAYDAASPIQHVTRAPPTLLIHGARDELVRVAQSRRLFAALRPTSRRHTFLELPWATHGCDYNLSGPCGQISVFAIEQFLTAVLK